ncbi:MAG: GNAT family N-acetyltransferase [Chloroflexota bacterium]|nr:GNAT family N-acetyltransferase [Chloroflexota bacterium]
MANAEKIHIETRVSLTPAELAEISALKARCDAEEGLDLKLGYGAADPAEALYPAAWLARAGDTLVGYLSLEGDETVAEMCGMVHPDWRRQRIGIRLFNSARGAFAAMGGRQIFAVCEDASASGRVFLRMLAGQRAFSEHRMVLRADAPLTASADGGLTITAAEPDDLRPLAAALARAFENAEERLLADLTSASALATEQVYVARLDGAIIGGFRLSVMPDATGIYAFGVDRAYQRHGWGRQMLAAACALAREQGAPRVSLEVETENSAAIALYEGSGFAITTTYGYYIFSPTLLIVGLDLDEDGRLRASPDDAAGDEKPR